MSDKLAVKQETVPSWFTESTDGAEDFGTGDIKLSQIYLTQQMSEAAADGTARPGDFVDSVTGKNYGKELSVIILKKYVEWIAFRPKKDEDIKRDAEMGILWAEGEKIKRSVNGKVWTDGVAIPSQEAWKYEQYKYFVLVQGEQGLPSILSFKNTSKKAGKDLANLLFRFTHVSKEPIYARSYKLSSEAVKNDKGTFFVIKTTIGQGFISEEEAMSAKSFREFIQANQHSIVTEEQE